MADRFTYSGQSTLGYFSYADTDTGRMLIADPGGSYGIRAVEAGLPVPPGDGRWASAASTPLPPPSPPPLAAAAVSTGSGEGTKGGEL